MAVDKACVACFTTAVVVEDVQRTAEECRIAHQQLVVHHLHHCVLMTMPSPQAVVLFPLLACVLYSTNVQAETPANCGMSATTGCLNGAAYNYLDKKACGNNVYDRQTTVS